MLQDIRLFSWQYALTEIIFVIRFLRSYIILDKAAILVSTLTCTSIQELPERVHGDRFLLQIALRCSPQIRLGWKPCRLAVVFFFLGFSVCESFGPRLGCYNKRMEKGYTCHDARPWKPTKRSVWIHKTLLQQFVSETWNGNDLPVSTSVFPHPWCHPSQLEDRCTSPFAATVAGGAGGTTLQGLGGHGLWGSHLRAERLRGLEKAGHWWTSGLGVVVVLM